MKLNLQRHLFLEKLQTASRFTSSRLSSSSSLQGILIKGEEGYINFFSTNLNYSYHSKLKYNEKNKFEIIIEPKRIIEFLSLLTEEDLIIELKEKSLIINQGKTVGEFALLSTATKEFPLPPQIKEKKQDIKTAFLRENLPLLLFSASNDETRPVLTGINFVSDEDRLQLISTDGFRLSLLSLKKNYDFSSMIVPSGFLSEVIRLTGELREISLSYVPEEKLLVFFIGDNNLYTRLIEGDFPPFDKVVPSEKKTTIEVDKEGLLRSIKLISVFARELSNIVIIKTEKDEIRVSPKIGDGEKNTASVDAKIEGEDQKIAFNYKFILDFLNNTAGKTIIIEMLRSDSPVVFKIGGVDNFIHIIMPVRIQE